jgi:hypothetical protein
MGQYLQDKGEGTLDGDILVDIQPNTPDNVVSLYDKGGIATAEAPETWRELYVQVRDTSHQNCYNRVWRVLGYFLYPATTFVEVGDNKYTVQLKEMPSSLGQDGSNRYLSGFRVVVYGVNGVTVADDWLNKLADWSGAVLSGWQVYRIWTGNKRPSVTWKLAGVQLFENSKASYEMRRRYTGSLLGSTPSELASGAAALVQELGCVVKLVLDDSNKRYLWIKEPILEVPSGSLTAGTVSVVLSKVMNRPFEDAPLMSAVHYKENIN